MSKTNYPVTVESRESTFEMHTCLGEDPVERLRTNEGHLYNIILNWFSCVSKSEISNTLVF